MNSLEHTQQENYRKKKTGRRLIFSWVVVAVFSFALGYLTSFLVSLQPSAPVMVEAVDVVPEPLVEEVAGVDTFHPLPVPLAEDLQKYVYDKAQEVGIDFTFLLAVIEQESNYRPDVISSTNDYGLMQINKVNHKELGKVLGVTDFLDPRQNIDCGVYMLRRLFDKYDDPHKVLMAYNMGETGAGKLWKKGTTESKYSRSVLDIQTKLNAMRERTEQP